MARAELVAGWRKQDRVGYSLCGSQTTPWSDVELLVLIARYEGGHLISRADPAMYGSRRSSRALGPEPSAPLNAQTSLAVFAAIIFSGIDVDITIATRPASPPPSLHRRCITAADARSAHLPRRPRRPRPPPSGSSFRPESAHPTLRRPPRPVDSTHRPNRQPRPTWPASGRGRPALRDAGGWTTKTADRWRPRALRIHKATSQCPATWTRTPTPTTATSARWTALHRSQTARQSGKQTAREMQSHAQSSPPDGCLPRPLHAPTPTSPPQRTRR